MSTSRGRPGRARRERALEAATMRAASARVTRRAPAAAAAHDVRHRHLSVPVCQEQPCILEQRLGVAEPPIPAQRCSQQVQGVLSHCQWRSWVEGCSRAESESSSEQPCRPPGRRQLQTAAASSICRRRRQRRSSANVSPAASSRIPARGVASPRGAHRTSAAYRSDNREANQACSADEPGLGACVPPVGAVCSSGCVCASSST